LTVCLHPDICGLRSGIAVSDFLFLLVVLNPTHLIPGGITVVRTTKGRDAQPVMLDRVPVLPDLVGPDHSGDAVQLAPPLGHVGTETEANTPLGGTSALLFLRVGPE